LVTQPLDIDWKGFFKVDHLINFDDPVMKENIKKITQKVPDQVEQKLK